MTKAKAKNECAKRWQKKYPKKLYQNSVNQRIKAKQRLRQLKINGCAKCGYDRCTAALEFHHVNPEDKKFQICSRNMRKKDIADELNKCILLCCRCHREVENE